MDTFEFQNEAAFADSAWSKVDLDDAVQMLARGDAEQVSLLMLGLTRRGWLTEPEMAWLDSIAPVDHLTFLVQGDNYLHPKDLPLFPLELIDAAVTQGGMAQFSHRYRPEQGSLAGQSYEIRTAVIGENDEGPLVLGLFGPEHPDQTDRLDQFFGQVVGRFRQGFETASNLQRDAELTWDDHRAELLLAGKSGKVVDISPAAAQLLPRAERRLIGRTFDRLEALLAELSPGRRLTLRNVDRSTLPMSILTLASTRELVNTCPELSESPLLAACRARLQSINDGVARLEETVYSDESRADLQRIEKHTGELIDHLNDLSVLFDCDRLPVGRVSLANAVEVACDMIDPWLRPSGSVAVRSDQPNLSVEAPAKALTTLIKAALGSHLACHGPAGVTVVKVEGSGSSQPVSITFETENPGRIDHDRRDCLQDLARRLADRLEVVLIDSEHHRLNVKTKLNFKATA